MLSKLLIKNYALIDALDIEFDKKLNIITGETGAGKSIIMGALGLILGNRAESKHFFDESSKCVIEGHFEVTSYDLKELFNSLDLDYEDVTIIRRELHADGKSRAFVNDTPVTLQTLKLLGERLIDIHSQHASLQINTESFQLLVLDTVAQQQSLLNEYKENYQAYKKAIASLKALEEEISKSRAEYDFNQFIYNELEQANPQPDEQAALESEQNQLENAEEIKKYFHGAASLMQSDEQNVLDGLKSVLSFVQTGTKYLPSAESIQVRLHSTLIELKDIAAELEQVADGVSMDEERLTIVSDRLSLLYSLQKKHRVDSNEGLLNLLEDLSHKLQDSDSQEERIEVLKAEIDKLHASLAIQANKITENRISVKQHIEQEVQAVLAKVGMPNAQLQIELKKKAEFKSSGQDEVAFLFSANKGQTLQAIHKVASGGELSRVMLAIKSLVAKSSSLPTIIFDEIDTGISGEVALRVGEIMHQLSEHMQVISITHLPQIASQGNAHFKVYKEDGGEKTKSNIVLLKKEERIMEIAQMLSGANPEATAIKHAEEMLK
ncbi:DNA repair protein RecN [Sphingobacterium sp. DK4209]|uniref:DNA repair protein RecN n=1 Tax=Sphingobacterium zhuxiongii TaxID=2662364 RepID=A0A5Q0QBC3_9SPHI|nr:MULTISPECIES: DNA repair protein RecN [unclassified Sphingobacterium]MVZ67641.1 DNA repair protein RecN [Sphingobacterium sp. DK4209]QGA27205.1 DNA repair protein RecN [Sphingobacterium sp. dk4302]